MLKKGCIANLDIPYKINTKPPLTILMTEAVWFKGSKKTRKDKAQLELLNKGGWESISRKAQGKIWKITFAELDKEHVSNWRGAMWCHGRAPGLLLGSWHPGTDWCSDGSSGLGSSARQSRVPLHGLHLTQMWFKNLKMP